MKKGHITTEQERINKRLGQLGRKHSAEDNLKKSLKLKGKSNGKEGTFQSLETKQKISTAHKKLVELGVHPSLKGGITPLNNHIRQIFKYRQWRSDVFTRDNFTCQECGQRGGKIQADHIESFALIIQKYNIRTLNEAENCEELWNINNGRTLCIPCHKLTENFAGRNNSLISIYKVIQSNIT